METLSYSLSLAFLAEVTGRGYQREGFSGFLRAVNVLSPPRPRTRFARPRFALSRSDWAIHFPTQTPVGWFHARSLHSIRTIGSEYLSHSTVVLACRASGSRTRLVRIIQLIPVDCELCILERCRASFLQQDHAHLRI